MSTDLTGRALDAACARAMGLDVHGDPDCPTVFVPDGPRGFVVVEVAAYSTDASHIPELLKHLLVKHPIIEIEVTPGYVAAANRRKDERGRSVMAPAEFGRTVQEALTRLVVAMAEDEKHGK